MATQALNKVVQSQPLGPPCFTKGQKVWLNTKNLMLPYRTITLAPKHHGPFEIEEVRSLVVYQLRLPPQWKMHPVFHASLLMPYIKTNKHGTNYTRPPPDMIEGEEQYEVKVIQAHQCQWGKLQYLIKWIGYPESDNTWEPVENVQAPQLVKEYHKVHPQEDKRTTKQARMTSFLTPTSQPTQLIESGPKNTFNTANKAAVRLAAAAAAAAAPTPKATSTAGLLTLTHKPPPQNLCASLTSILETPFTTLPPIPHINLSTSAHLQYPIFIPQFMKVTSTSHAPHSATSHTPTALNTSTFVKILAAWLMHCTKCPACPHLSQPATHCSTH
jgi:hypothetical protein